MMYHERKIVIEILQVQTCKVKKVDTCTKMKDLQRIMIAMNLLPSAEFL